MVKRFRYNPERKTDIYFFWQSKHEKTRIAIESYMNGERNFSETCKRYNIATSTLSSNIQRLEFRGLIISMKTYRTTLDIDYNDKDLIERMKEKISRCPFLREMKIRDSSLKGMHVFLFCSKECFVCRLVYDDFRRLAYDQNRPEYARNILFDTKIFPIRSYET